MKKLSLKNLKILKISDKEKASITGGGYGGASSCAQCGSSDTSNWPIICGNSQWTCN